MLIESSTITTSAISPTPSYRLPLILGTIITLTAAALPILFVVTPRSDPTGSLLSPLPEGTITENLTPRSPALRDEDPSVARRESVDAKGGAIIAISSDQPASSSSQTGTTANANKKIITFPANASQFVVTDPAVTENSYIYLTKISDTNATIYIQSKGRGYFTLGINHVSDGEIALNYYLVND